MKTTAGVDPERRCGATGSLNVVGYTWRYKGVGANQLEKRLRGPNVASGSGKLQTPSMPAKERGRQRLSRGRRPRSGPGE